MLYTIRPRTLRVAQLKTGQTTQYSSELDDGFYEKGVAKNYKILTTGQYSSTVNVDMAHYTSAAGGITFTNATKTIADTGNGLAIFKTGDVILTNSASNPGPFTVTTGNVAGAIVCSGATFVDETPAGAITFSKREAISNNVVEDLETGLMWQRTPSLKMGLTSVGTMPWTGVLYDIFAFCAAANAASLGGHTDWRIPNGYEAATIGDSEASTGLPDSTAFPSFPSGTCWSSTTATSNTSFAQGANYGSGALISASNPKTTSLFEVLVRSIYG